MERHAKYQGMERKAMGSFSPQGAVKHECETVNRLNCFSTKNMLK
jgi:hypothetical protein